MTVFELNKMEELIQLLLRILLLNPDFENPGILWIDTSTVLGYIPWVYIIPAPGSFHLGASLRVAGGIFLVFT